MIEVEHNLWDLEADVRCVTTNGTVMADGSNVMGGGCAFECARLYPDVPRRLGQMIERYGNHVYLLGPELVSFPTKEDVRNRSTRMRVLTSAYELLALANLYGWEKIALPRPGSGLGGLNYELTVRPLLTGLLDDRFLIVDFPRLPVYDEAAAGARRGYGG